MKNKRWFSLFLSLLMVVTQLPAVNFQTVAAKEASSGEAEEIKTEDEKKKEELFQQYLKEKELPAESGSYISADSSSVRQMIRNDYLEFMVNSDDGRFTIGNVEGNPDYTSDNNKILLYGHPSPWSSFSTIRLESSQNERKDIKFDPDGNIEYDAVNKKVIAEMNLTGSFNSGEPYNFIITQILSFVKGNSNREDTVKINYEIKNKGSLGQRAGIRIMIDTMLAAHDDAPFKVPGHGNVISELELAGSAVPSSYQVYDDLNNPTTFATGTLYRANDRRPDKVQFSYWPNINSTYYDYTIRNHYFGDSAVGIYFNPVNIAPSDVTNVCTYYGINNNPEDVPDVNQTKYGVLVYDSVSREYISGAVVKIGDKTAQTGSNGFALFEDFAANNNQTMTVTVSKDGYETTEVSRRILCGTFTGIGIAPSGSTQPSILSAVLQSGASDIYDLLTTYVYYDEAKENEASDSSVSIKVTNAGSVDTYRLVQDDKIKYESTNGTFTIPVVTKDKDGKTYEKPRICGLSAGQNVTLQLVKDNVVVASTDLALKISKPVTRFSTSGSLSIGGNIKFKVPDNIPIFAGADFEFGINNNLPVRMKVSEDGKIKFGVTEDLQDNSGLDAWEEYKKSYHNALKETDKIKNAGFGAAQWGDSGWLKNKSYGAGAIKFNCDIMGYGEGIIDVDGNVNAEIGLVLKVSQSNSYTQYFYIGTLPVYVTIGQKGEIAAQIKGNIEINDGNLLFNGGDCTIEPSFELNLEGGAGVKGAYNVSAEGKAKLNTLYRFSDNYSRVWMTGEFSIKTKMLMFEKEIVSLKSNEWVLWDSNNPYNAIVPAADGTSSFELSERDSSMYTDVKEVTTANGNEYRFYLADISERQSQNRTAIVYQKHSGDTWSEPVIIKDDKTADFDFALAVNDNKVYIAWENMSKEFNADVALDDMVANCQIKLACLDAADGDKITDLYTSSVENSKGAFFPAVATASNGDVKVAWYCNSENNVASSTQSGKDSIYSVTLSDGTGAGTEPEKKEITSGRIVSLAIGTLGKECAIVYALDKDGDFSTETDVALYKYAGASGDDSLIADSASNAKFAMFDRNTAMFYYDNGNIAYKTTDGSIHFVFDKEAVPMGISDSFSVLSDNTGSKTMVLWKSANEDGGEDIYASRYQGSNWSKPYILKSINGSNVSIPSGSIKNDGAVSISYGYTTSVDGSSNSANIVTENIQEYTDISLDDISVAQENIKPGASVDFNIHVSNKGNTDISSAKLKVLDIDGNIVKEETDIPLSAGVGETVSYTVENAFTAPETFNGLANYKVVISADGEKEDTSADNEHTFSIGYTDISVKEIGKYVMAGDSYMTLQVSNESDIPSKGTRVKILADSMDGIIVYDKLIGTLEAREDVIYNVNVSQLSNSSQAYLIASSDSKELSSYNNTELVAANPSIDRSAETVRYNFSIASQEGGKIVCETNETYAAGTKINIKAEFVEGYREKGYIFEGWYSNAGNFEDASSLETVFTMPEQNVVLTAGFVKSPNSGIYMDGSYNALAESSDLQLYINGSNVKQEDSTKINFKQKTYYTKLSASKITVNNKGKTKTKDGKLIAGVTSSANVPSIVKGKIVDTEAAKIAKASISKGKIKVTAKGQPGTIYLWVMDTGDEHASVYARMTVRPAPSKVQIFAKSSSDTGFSADNKSVYKKDTVEVGSSLKLYLYPTYKLNKVMTETKDASFNISVNDKAKDYFTVTKDPDNPYCFIVTATGLKNNKKTAGKIIIKCNQNGKKAVFTATAANSVQDIKLDSLNGLVNDTATGTAVSGLTIAKQDTAKATGTFTLITTNSSSNFATTDKPKLYAMGSENGFDKAKMEKGKVKITSKADSNQRKLKAKLGHDKKTVTVTADKKVTTGTSVYYLIVYNTKEGKGYKVIKISVV